MRKDEGKNITSLLIRVRVMQPSEDLISHVLRVAPHWIGTNGQRLDAEILSFLLGFGGYSRWSSLFSGPNWGTGLTSDSGRMSGLGGGAWPMPSLTFTALPRFRTALSGLHGRARGPQRSPRHYRTSDCLTS